MKTINCNTIQEYKDLPDFFEEFTVIYIKFKERINIFPKQNSSVVARGNSSVEAWENSSVVARENSSVEAWGNSIVRVFSINSVVSLMFYSVCYVLIKNNFKFKKRAKTATVIIPFYNNTVDEYLRIHDINVDDNNFIVLYKRVSKDFKTQEKTRNETFWEVGSCLDIGEKFDISQECGEGKYHACARPFFCDEFRGQAGDKYIAIRIKKEDLYVFKNPSYPHKAAFSKGEVLYEVDKMGNKI